MLKNLIDGKIQNMEGFLFGFGFDIHPLVRGRRLFIGGIEIPSELGALGHSDGDALLHALIDASLSASGLPDIGSLFPDTDSKYKDIPSTHLLLETKNILRELGINFYQVDITLILDSPKLSPFYGEIKGNLERLLEIPAERIGLKARRTEGVLFIPDRPAIIALAMVVLKKNLNAQDS